MATHKHSQRYEHFTMSKLQPNYCMIVLIFSIDHLRSKKKVYNEMAIFWHGGALSSCGDSYYLFSRTVLSRWDMNSSLFRHAPSNPDAYNYYHQLFSQAPTHRFSSSFLTYAFVQPSCLHLYGLMPKWLRIWGSRCDFFKYLDLIIVYTVLLLLNTSLGSTCTDISLLGRSLWKEHIDQETM